MVSIFYFTNIFLIFECRYENKWYNKCVNARIHTISLEVSLLCHGLSLCEASECVEIVGGFHSAFLPIPDFWEMWELSVSPWRRDGRLVATGVDDLLLEGELICLPELGLIGLVDEEADARVFIPIEETWRIWCDLPVRILNSDTEESGWWLLLMSETDDASLLLIDREFSSMEIFSLSVDCSWLLFEYLLFNRSIWLPFPCSFFSCLRSSSWPMLPSDSMWYGISEFQNPNWASYHGGN